MRAHQRKRRDQIRTSRSHQAGDHGSLAAFVFLCSFLLRFRRGQIQHKSAHRHAFHLFKAHIREPCAARRLRAVAAQAHADRRILLTVARLRIERKGFPAAVGIVHIIARAKDAEERYVCADLIRIAALRHHARSQLIGRILAYGHCLLKPGVVGSHVFNQNSLRAILQRHRFQIRRTGACHPHAGVPAIGHAARDGGKIAVLQQIALLNGLILLSAKKHRSAEDQCDHEQRCNKGHSFLVFHPVMPPISARPGLKRRPLISKRILNMDHTFALNLDHIKPRLPIHQAVSHHIVHGALAYAPLLRRGNGLAARGKATRSQLHLNKDDHAAVAGDEVNLRAGRNVAARKDLITLLRKKLFRADFAQRSARTGNLVHRHTFTKLPMNERLCAGQGPYSLSAAICCAVP